MNQTAIDYFYDMVLKVFMKYHEDDVPTIDFGKLITEAHEQAKKMEKDQITDAYIYARISRDHDTYLDDEANKYYYQTFNQ